LQQQQQKGFYQAATKATTNSQQASNNHNQSLNNGEIFLPTIQRWQPTCKGGCLKKENIDNLLLQLLLLREETKKPQQWNFPCYDDLCSP
jgi:hypothetical protein